MEHVETAKLVDGRADRRLQAVGVGHIGTDRDRLICSEVSGFLASLGIDLGNSDFGAFAREQDGSGAAYPGASTGDEGYLACETCIDPSFPIAGAKTVGAGGSQGGIVAYLGRRGECHWRYATVSGADVFRCEEILTRYAFRAHLRREPRLWRKRPLTAPCCLI
jgi:hypothetical protein